MRGFLLSTCAICILLIAVAEIVLSVFALRRYKTGRQPIVLCIAVLTMGLVLDALVIDLGVVYTGTALKYISRLRYVCHGVLVPLLFPISGYGLKLGKKAMKVVWAVTAAVMVAGLAANMTISLEAREIAGIIRYAEMDGSPAWVEAVSFLLTIGAVIPVIICGIIVWMKQKTPYLFLAGFFMFAFSALGPATGNVDLIFYISMYGELLMVLLFYLYAKRDERLSRK